MLDGQPTLKDYLRVTLFLTAFSCLLAWLTSRARGLAAEPAQLLGPMFALAALTAVVWLLMVVVISILASVMPARHATHISVRESLAYA